MGPSRRVKKSAAPPPSDDDSSVDSKGNLKDFIAYTDEESEEKDKKHRKKGSAGFKPKKYTTRSSSKIE